LIKPLERKTIPENTTSLDVGHNHLLYIILIPASHTIYSLSFKGQNLLMLLRKVYVLCFVDRVYRYILVTKTNLMHYLSSVYFVTQALHVSAIFVAHN
jgi:hypothetical protein